MIEVFDVWGYVAGAEFHLVDPGGHWAQFEDHWRCALAHRTRVRITRTAPGYYKMSGVGFLNFELRRVTVTPP